MSMYVLFFLYIPVGVHPCPAWALKPWIMRLGQTNIKLLKGRRSLLYNSKGKKITLKMPQFAFFVQTWHCDTVEKMKITATSKISAYWSSRISVFCCFFSLFLFYTGFKQLSLIAAVSVVAMLMVKDQSPSWSDSQHLSNKMHHHFLGNC